MSATKIEASHGVNKTYSINIFLAMTLALYKKPGREAEHTYTTTSSLFQMTSQVHHC